MIELLVYKKPKNKKAINNSSFCSKTEIYLKLNNIDHKITNFTGNPGKFKKSKLPVIKHNNKIIEDSYFIEQYLNKEFSIDMDKHLSPSEKAQGMAFVKMVENYLYWSLLHERWFIDSNWSDLKRFYFGSIPKPIRGFVTKMIRKDVRKSANGHGMGRHSDKDVHHFGVEGVKALSDFLADKKYLLGDKVSSYDAAIYAVVSCVLHSTLGPRLKEAIEGHYNLVEYDKRMFELFDK